MSDDELPTGDREEEDVEDKESGSSEKDEQAVRESTDQLDTGGTR